MDTNYISRTITRDLYKLSGERGWCSDNDSFCRTFFIFIDHNESLNKFEIRIEVYREYFTKWKEEYGKYIAGTEKLLDKYFCDAVIELFQNDKRLLFNKLRYVIYPKTDFEFTIDFIGVKSMNLNTDRYRFTI